MGRSKEVCVCLRKRIVRLHLRGLSQRTIADLLDVSRGAERNTVQRFKETGEYRSTQRNGRPRLTNAADDRHRPIIRHVKSNRRDALRKIRQRFIEIIGTNISARTTQRRLHEAGFYGRVVRKSAFITRRNRLARVQWCRAHKSHSVEEFWSRVLFLDECGFKVMDCDGS